MTEGGRVRSGRLHAIPLFVPAVGVLAAAWALAPGREVVLAGIACIAVMVAWRFVREDLPHRLEHLRIRTARVSGRLATLPRRIVFVGRGVPEIGPLHARLLLGHAVDSIVFTTDVGAIEVFLRDVGQCTPLSCRVSVRPKSGIRHHELSSRTTELVAGDLVVVSDAAAPGEQMITTWQGLSSSWRRCVEICVHGAEGVKASACAARAPLLALPLFALGRTAEGRWAFRFHREEQAYGVDPDAAKLLRRLGFVL